MMVMTVLVIIMERMGMVAVVVLMVSDDDGDNVGNGDHSIW